MKLFIDIFKKHFLKTNVTIIEIPMIDLNVFFKLLMMDDDYANYRH